MTTDKAKLQAINITKSFLQGSTSIPVLKGVNVTFEQGNSYAITGSSGSGKSTLLHLLASLDTPDQGSILFNELNTQHFTPHQHEHFLNKSIGLLFQAPYLIQELTVLENVMLKGLISGQNKNHAEHHALQLLTIVGLKDKIHEFPAALSGGQQQRVALVRAIFNKPAFLLADEPTAHLDMATGKTIIDLLLEYQTEWSMGLIICSHDHYVSQAMQTILHLNDGKLH